MESAWNLSATVAPARSRHLIEAPSSGNIKLRIVIDMQSAQAPGYKDRGIGRYSLSLALALARQADKHEVLLALNGSFPDSIAPLREKFRELISPENIKIWHGLTPTHALNPQNRWRRKATELLREEFLATLKPDIVLVTSLFQGLGDNSTISIGCHRQDLLTAVICYDLIPLIYSDHYLTEPAMRVWYHERLDHLRRADLILAISESSRLESVNYIGIENSQTVNISSAIDNDFFRPTSLGSEEETQIRSRYGLTRPFMMYTGDIYPHKNIDSLIVAFSRLNKTLRRKYQLAVVCALPEPARDRLERFVAKHGLEPQEVIFTNFVSNSDLLALYNLCHLFIFPSWHEGFGLPALEAMACGAPTIASNCSSLPEVIGWNKALFDPRDARDIARAIEHALTDESFRQKLKAHGLRQAKQFSWDLSAKRALRAMEDHVESHQATRPASLPIKPMTSRPRLAYFSPLQPAKSGIADYSAELLPELSRHYDIDVIVDQENAITDHWVLANSTQRNIAWFENHADDYDRILYHFGNSPFHKHMFDLLERFPGIVTLHDFFLSGIIANMDLTNMRPGIWARSLQRAHGWEALGDRYGVGTTSNVEKIYPCNLEILQRAQGIICHSDYSRKLAAQWYGPDWGTDWALIPHLRAPAMGSFRKTARQALGISDDEFMVCSFGSLGPSKFNSALIEAWRDSALSIDKSCVLVFVGEFHDPDYERQIWQLLQVAAFKDRIRITSWVDADSYRKYLEAADLAVQLRTLSRGETSGATLDCMNYGIPTIVNANGSMAELPSDAVQLLPDKFTTGQLTKALERLWRSSANRAALGKRAAEHIRKYHSPRRCAELYAGAIEQFARTAGQGVQNLVAAAVRLEMPNDRYNLVNFAERAAELFTAPRPHFRQLLLDVSELAQRDSKTGIQRVVRSILEQLLRHPPKGYRVEPVFATMDHGYRYARRFTARFLGMDEALLLDDPVEFYPEDVFFGLDWASELVFHHRELLHQIRLKGAMTYFFVYDILPATFPEFFPNFMAAAELNWLETLSQADGVICISHTVAIELQNWLLLFAKRERRPLKVGWAHLGSDLIRKVEGHNNHPLQRRLTDAMTQHPSFLMVGTVEPRKGHPQVLAAFDLLWRGGVNVNLVIIGKLGWLDGADEHLRLHPERERRLFWLEGVGDDVLEQIYAASSCLIAASADEGFGLPLIEAARHKLPILARDIPVFREVAGDHASYFTGDEPRAVAEAVKSWLALDREGRAPRSDAMPWLTWKQSTQNLLDIILNDKWQSEWVPEKDPNLLGRYWGSDHRFGTQVGERRGESLWSTGRAGYLLHGPYIPLKKGLYVAIIRGRVGFAGLAGAHADVAIEQGTRVLAKVDLQPDLSGEEGPLATLAFQLKDDCVGLEFRVFVEEESDVEISLLELRKDTDHLVHSAAAGHRETMPPSRHELLRPAPQGWEHRYWATHPLMHTAVGHRVGRSIWTTGKAGYLLHGPYIGLRTGRYVATIFGTANRPCELGSSFMDVAADQGTLQLGTKMLSVSDVAQDILGTINFALDGYTENVEIRVWVDADADLHVTGLEISEMIDEAAFLPATLAKKQDISIVSDTQTMVLADGPPNGLILATASDPSNGRPASITIDKPAQLPAEAAVQPDPASATIRHKRRTSKAET